MLLVLTKGKASESDWEKEIQKRMENLTAAEKRNFEQQIEWTNREESMTKEKNVLKELVDHQTRYNETLNMRLNEMESAMKSLKSEHEIELNAAKMLNISTKDEELEKLHKINADLQQKVAVLEQKYEQVIFGLSFIDL